MAEIAVRIVEAVEYPVDLGRRVPVLHEKVVRGRRRYVDHPHGDPRLARQALAACAPADHARADPDARGAEAARARDSRLRTGGAEGRRAVRGRCARCRLRVPRGGDGRTAGPPRPVSPTPPSRPPAPGRSARPCAAIRAASRSRPGRPSPSGPGPRIAAAGSPRESPGETQWEERCRTRSWPRSCFSSKRQMRGSSTSRQRGVRPRRGMERSSPGRGRGSRNGCVLFGPGARASVLRLPECRPGTAGTASPAGRLAAGL